MLRRAKVAIIMGSDSDLPTMGEATKVLEDYGVGYKVRILSVRLTATPRLTLWRWPNLRLKLIILYLFTAGWD